MAKDDASKNYLKGMLDLLFDKDKRDERIQFKKIWEGEQEKKSKLEAIKNEALNKIKERKKMEEEE